jgi:hypothetical protein
MPDVADSALQIANNALYLIGAEVIEAFTDSTPQANVANAVYEDTVISSLSTHRWRFASKQRDLVRMSVEPEGRWDASYKLPADMVIAQTITVRDNPIEYDIYGDRAYCNAATTDTLVLDYVSRADESAWPSMFKQGVQFSLAAIFAMTLARDGNMSQLMDQRAQLAFMKARQIDSQQQTSRKLHTQRFLVQRRS